MDRDDSPLALPTAAARGGMRATALRIGLTGMHRLFRMWWFFRRPRTFGVRAIALTPQGAVVMVRHSYISGWHLPGGGIARGEDRIAATLRELREEIGMTGHGAVRHFGDYANRPDFRRDTVSLHIVEDVTYCPRLSLEIEEIAAFDLHALPEGTSPATRRRIAEWREEKAPDAQW